MPELPEAETIVRDLRRRVLDRPIVGTDVSRPDVLGGGLDPERLDARSRGAVISAVGRRGKNVVLSLSNGDTLLVNLGMTGRLVDAAAPRAVDLSHVAVRFRFKDEGALLYDDIRRFGRVELLDPRQWRERNSALGIEPLGDDLTPERMHALTRHTRVPIRNLLLDQSRVAGVGNIYANEALFRAGVRPQRRARTLRRIDSARLRDAIRDVLQDAIRARGTTLRDYRDGSGEAGSFEPLLEVYGREGQPCPICGTPIKRLVITNRSAFYCPQCQS